jgi:hypothetical protein
MYSCIPFSSQTRKKVMCHGLNGKKKWITVTEARENNFMNQRGLLGLDIIEVIYNTSPYI